MVQPQVRPRFYNLRPDARRSHAFPAACEFIWLKPIFRRSPLSAHARRPILARPTTEGLTMKPWLRAIALVAPALALGVAPSRAQMLDNTQATNPIKAGINKSLSDEVGTGRGNVNVVGSSAYIIARDPFRSIRRGRQLFQRKFTNLQGQGPNEQDGIGDIALDKGIGAGLSDSCASCHGRPRGSAGVGGDVATRPDSRDSSHLFGLGLKEMLADEITADLRAIRDSAIAQARQWHRPVTSRLM